MEKRFLLALGLSIVVLVVWQQLFPPPKPPEPAPDETPAVADGPRAGDPATGRIESAGEADAPVDSSPEEPDAPAFESVAAGAEESLEYENDIFQVTFSNRGGRVVSWKLKEYSTKEGSQLDLIPRFVDDSPWFPLALDFDDASLAPVFNEALYEMRRIPAAGGETIEFRWADGQGLSAVKSLTFGEGSYIVDLDVRVEDRGRYLPARVAWGPGFGAQDPKAEASNYYYSGQIAWNNGGQVSRVKRKKADPSRTGGNLRWAGLNDQYFAALFIPGTGASLIDLKPEELTRIPPGEAAPDGEAEPEKVVTVAVQVPESGAQLFVGPKKYTLLSELGHDLDEVIWFSSFWLLAAIAKFLFLSLLWIHNHTIANYGLAIVMTTFILRVVLFPLNQYSMVSIRKSQQQMQRIQPKVNALRNRYKKMKDAESRGKMNQELMELYKREGVNPMGGVTGCLPMLAQFPILIGFYNMLTVVVELRGAPFFGWITDLSEKDPYYITPLLMGVTMFWQQRLAMSKVTDPQQRQQQKIMMLMPFFFTYICTQMPSGLVLYWFVNNILGIGQQWLVNRKADGLQPAPQKA